MECTVKKIYVNPDDGARITCDTCHKTTKVQAAYFSKAEKAAKVRCRCGSIFEVEIEKRKHSRKKAYIPGVYMKDNDPSIYKHMIIHDLSFFGACLKLDIKDNINIKDNMHIEFILENKETKEKTEIEKYVTVSWASNNFVGVEFLNPNSYAEEIDEYLKSDSRICYRCNGEGYFTDRKIQEITQNFKKDKDRLISGNQDIKIKTKKTICYVCNGNGVIITTKEKNTISKMRNKMRNIFYLSFIIYSMFLVSSVIKYGLQSNMYYIMIWFGFSILFYTAYCIVDAAVLRRIHQGTRPDTFAATAPERKGNLR